MKDRFTKNDVIPPSYNKHTVQHSLQLPQIWDMKVSFPPLFSIWQNSNLHFIFPLVIPVNPTTTRGILE